MAGARCAHTQSRHGCPAALEERSDRAAALAANWRNASSVPSTCGRVTKARATLAHGSDMAYAMSARESIPVYVDGRATAATLSARWREMRALPVLKGDSVTDPSLHRGVGNNRRAIRGWVVRS